MRNQILKLVEKYKENNCSKEEVAELLEYIRSGEHAELLAQFIADGLLDDLPESFMESPEMKAHVAQLNPFYGQQDEVLAETSVELVETTSTRVLRIPTWLKIAAVLLLVSGISLYVFLQKQRDTGGVELLVDADPAGNRALLTLADGSTVTLSDAHAGIVLENGEVAYEDGSKVALGEVGSSGPSSAVVELALRTPKGGKYQVTLADGTKVWLNAGSLLKYPASFVGAVRRVELQGEAYFEVAKNEKQPFIVASAGQEVQVLGTHFNITAYPDESQTKTTLVEGSVRVRQTEAVEGIVLDPGQQAAVVLGAKGIQVKNVNTSDYTAWKDNLLLFDQQSLRSILLTLSRWYDFEVDNSQIPDASLSGVVPTNVKLSEVLSLLEETSGVKLKIENTGVNGERRVTRDLAQ